MTIVELAFEVGTALANHGVVAVLSGGGAATTYAPEAYQTQDLDFILQSFRAKFDPILELGFRPLDDKSINQAVAVARRHPVDLKLIEAWCSREGGARTFGLFVERLR